MQTARSNAGIAVVNDKIYVIGGNDINGRYCVGQGFFVGHSGGTVGTNEVYDPVVDTWSYRASMSTARDRFAIVVYQNEIYCIGGRSNIPEVGPPTFTRVSEVYDPVSDSWRNVASFPVVEEMVKAVVVGNFIYVIGKSGVVYEYNPLSDVWVTKSVVPSLNRNSRADFVAVAVEDKIYVVGISRLNQVYDPLDDSWVILDSIMPYGPFWLLGVGAFEVACGATVGVLASKRIYIFSGNSTSVYDLVTDSWVAAAPMPSARGGYGVAVINDTFYAVGGGSVSYEFISDYFPVALNQRYLPVGYGVPDPSYVLEHSLPVVCLSPINRTGVGDEVELVFNVSKSVGWMGYSLDGAQNVTIVGNTTLSKLLGGLHNVTVFVSDVFGNVGASETLVFVVVDYFPVAGVGVVFLVVVVGVVVGVVFLKRRR